MFNHRSVLLIFILGLFVAPYPSFAAEPSQKSGGLLNGAQMTNWVRSIA